jgi:hypothetical protein
MLIRFKYNDITNILIRVKGINTCPQQLIGSFNFPSANWLFSLYLISFSNSYGQGTVNSSVAKIILFTKS